MRNDKENLIVSLTFDLALDIIAYSEKIRMTHRFLKWHHKFSEAVHQSEQI